MARITSILIVVGLFLAGSSCTSQSPTFFRSTFHDYNLVTVVEGLEHPWSIAFLPEGDMLVTERTGRLRIIRDGVLLTEPVPGVPEVLAKGQGGLLDVVIHPDFTSNRLIYLSYSKPIGDGSSATTAVLRGRFENDQLIGVEDIYEAKEVFITSASSFVTPVRKVDKSIINNGFTHNMRGF